MEESLLKLLASDSFITLNKGIIQIFGLEEAVIIGELVSEYQYWQNNDGIDDGGFFYSTIENIQEKTTLTGHQQRKALKNLENAGVVIVKRKGVPAKRYIKISKNRLLKVLTSSCEKIEHLDVKKMNGNNNIEKEYRKINKNTPDKKEIEKEIEKIEDSQLREALNDYVEMRKAIKSPMTLRAYQLAIKKLDDMTSSNEIKVKILEQSTMNSWKGLFELKTDMKGGSPTQDEAPKFKTIYDEMNDNYKIW